MSMRDFYRSLSIERKELDLEHIDFRNDCSVLIICIDNNSKTTEEDKLIYNYNRLVVMSDEMLNYEAMKIASALIQDKQMGELIGIYIARNHKQYDYINNLFDSCIFLGNID